METSPEYHGISSRYKTSQPPKVPMLYDSRINVPNTIPDEMTAHQPEESRSEKASAMRWRAVSFRSPGLKNCTPFAGFLRRTSASDELPPAAENSSSPISSSSS